MRWPKSRVKEDGTFLYQREVAIGMAVNNISIANHISMKNNVSVLGFRDNVP
jgi:hypothetical protein